MPTDPFELFRKLRERSPRTTLPDGREAWIVEGDLVLDEGQLDEYAAELALRVDAFEAAKAQGTPEDEGPRRLVAEQQGGRILRWHPEVVLSYRVARASFPDAGLHGRVAAAVWEAAQGWMAVCDVRFAWLSEHDEAVARPDTCLFEVAYQEQIPGDLIARAFFPREPRPGRVLLVSALWEQPLGYDKVGMFRHELGHVLGFRHEFVHPAMPGGPLFEEGAGLPIAVGPGFDSKSCMHYPMQGFGDPDFVITPVDAQAAREIYGTPRDRFEYCR